MTTAKQFGGAALAPTGFPTTRTTRILLVDDHPVIRAGIERLIEDQLDLNLVRSVEDARSALADAVYLEPDVAVVDYHLRGENGLVLTRRLKRLADGPRVLMYTAFADDTFTAAAIVAGADGITSKGALGDELCNSIRAIARGHRVFERLSRPLRDAMSAGLSPRDEAIFRMLVHGDSPSAIADALRIDSGELDRRRDAILRALTGAPIPAEQAGRSL